MAQQSLPRLHNAQIHLHSARRAATTQVQNITAVLPLTCPARPQPVLSTSCLSSALLRLPSPLLTWSPLSQMCLLQPPSPLPFLLSPQNQAWWPQAWSH